MEWWSQAGSRPSRGGHDNEEAEGDSDRPWRTNERHSGTGRGNKMRLDGGGRRNRETFTDDAFAWGAEDDMNDDMKIANPEKQEQEDAHATDAGEEEEEEDKEMTLEEYEKIREEKRKALLVLKTEERKVEIDSELKTMQQLSLKKGTDEVFIKLGSYKEKKENDDKEEKFKKSVSITECLQPAQGERYHSAGSHGRGRGNQGDCGSFQGSFGGSGGATYPSAPSIEDPKQFASLSLK